MTRRKPSKFSIGIIGEITQESTDKAISNWVAVMNEYRPGDVVDVIISSPGGDLDAGVAIYEFLKTSGIPFSTKGYGLVGSTAVLIFMAGNTRYLSEGSYIFVHEGTADVGGSIATVQSYSDHNRTVHTWYCRQIADRSDMTLQAVMKYASAETFIVAQKALELGLTDIVQPYDEVKYK